MTLDQDTLADWFERGKSMGATHLIVVCDTFDYEDYPVFVMPNEDVRKKAFEYGNDNGGGKPTIVNNNMQRVMEVYSLSLPMDEQYAERRAFHFE